MTERVHAFADDALGGHDAVGLAAAIQAGEVAITEVVEAAIERAERVDLQLGGIAHRAYERARAEARDPRPGFFAGVPTWVKDNVDVAGMPTMQGSDAWTPHPARRDGDWARMYLATGLVPLGKSQLSEFGFSPSAEDPRKGAVRSPWDPTRTAGASSAGSAAMVAAGVVPIAHANDGGGSIRIPASVNGLVGLKPTRGRLAQDAVFRQMPVRIVSDGVVTRSVRDTAAFLREAERIYRPLSLPPIGDLTRPGRGRLRIGLNTTGVRHGADAEATAEAHRVATLLEELGHRVEETEPPVGASFPDDFVLHWAALAVALVRGGRRAHGRSWDPSRLEPFTLGLARHAQRRLHRLPGAVRRLRRTAARSAELHERFDVVLTPTLATATPRVGHLDPHLPFEELMERVMGWVAFTPLQNATGEPAVSLPLARTAGGLPLGMMFAAAAGREATLVELAYELEEACPFAPITAGCTDFGDAAGRV